MDYSRKGAMTSTEYENKNTASDVCGPLNGVRIPLPCVECNEMGAVNICISRGPGHIYAILEDLQCATSNTALSGGWPCQFYNVVHSNIWSEAQELSAPKLTVGLHGYNAVSCCFAHRRDGILFLSWVFFFLP